MADDKAILPSDGNYTPLYGFDLAEQVYKVGSMVWDVNTLSWVKASQSVVETDTLNVEMGTTNGLLQDLLDALTPNMMQIDEVSEELIYIGEAVPGSLETAAAWRIRKIDMSSGTVIEWADGDRNFDNRWDQRAQKIYS